MLKEYDLNRDFTIICKIGDTMEIDVIQKSLSWCPVLERIVVDSKERGNIEFKRLVEKYRCELGYLS